MKLKRELFRPVLFMMVKKSFPCGCNYAKIRGFLMAIRIDKKKTFIVLTMLPGGNINYGAVMLK